MIHDRYVLTVELLGPLLLASMAAVTLWVFIGIGLTVGFGLFPFLLISSTDPNSSLTLWDASSSHSTLLLTFWITVIFLPIVLMYTGFVYKVVWGNVTEANVLEDSHTLY